MTDVGIKALAAVLHVLQPDDRSLKKGDRSFTWLPFRLTQTVSASPVFQDGDIALSKLTARTVVAERVTAPESEVYRVLSELNRHALGSGYCYVPRTKRIEATAVAFVHADTLDWRALQFSGFAMLQLGMTQAEAAYIAHKCAGTVAAVADPDHGFPEQPDPFVGSIDQKWASLGRAASPFRDGDEFGTIQHAVNRTTRAATLGSTETGIAVEFPFADETSFARLAADEPHRRIGNGLRVRLFLPVEGTPDEQVERANTLNQAEALGGVETMHYGAWCLDAGATGDRERPLLQYQMFIPNAFHRVGVALDASYGVARRAQWADWGMNVQVSTADPRVLLMDRMRTWLDQQWSDQV